RRRPEDAGPRRNGGEVGCRATMLARFVLATALCATAAAQLPPAWQPPQNPSTHVKVVLGKILFWDEQLSSDDSIACGTCHLPEFGGSDGRGLQARHPAPA